MAIFDTNILNMNIEKNVYEIKNRALTNKQLLRNFLEGFIIKDNFSINDYITYHLLTYLENIQHEEYTYWIDTGITWLLWYQGKIGKLSEEEYKSLTTGYFKVHYIFNHKSYEEKIVQLYNFTLELKNIINEKLIQENYGFEIDIDLKNININHEGQFEYTYDKKTLFKEPSFNIRLIIKKKQQLGGARKPKGINRKIGFNKLGKEFEKILLEDFPIINEDFIRLNEDAFNNKIILDFFIEYYHTTDKRIINIDIFKNTYLITEEFNKSYNHKLSKLSNREKLNRLNEKGMMTYCLLNLSMVDDEFGLNIDKYRQELFFRNKNNIPYFLEDLLKTYNFLFNNFKSYNVFFIDKVNEIINKYKSPQFEVFKDYIDRWFVSIFRPSINSFILEINKELEEKFGVKLFIAGGDAMRRYENDISFTKDIDTKLYINNIIITNQIIQQEIQELLSTNPNLNEKIIIKDMVVGVIVKHIVKLRNYLEQNIKHIFDDILQYDHRETDKGTGVIYFKTSNNHKFVVDILLDSNNIDKFQQFRTRENKKRGDFPVDLYSIDFRTFIGEYDENGNLIGGKKKTHDISLLDVVLQDVDNYYPRYLNNDHGIPIASLEFLLEDFHKTYITDDRALARISSGKVKKDISRFNKILELYNKQLQGTLIFHDNGSILQINNINEIIINLKRNSSKFYDRHIYNIFHNFLTLIKNKQPVNIQDVISINHIFNNNNIQEILCRYPLLKIAIFNMIFLKINIFNEDLKKTEGIRYQYYIIDNDEIRNGYYPLFYKLCSINNKDGLVRHVIMFSNTKIKTLFKDNDIIIPQQKQSKVNIKKTQVMKNPIKKTTKQKPIKVDITPDPLPTTISSRGRKVTVNNYKDTRPKKGNIQNSQQQLSTIVSVSNPSQSQQLKRGLKRTASQQLQKTPP